MKQGMEDDKILSDFVWSSDQSRITTFLVAEGRFLIKTERENRT